MCGIEDSSIALITNNNNSLRNNEICHLNTKLLSQINLKCTIDQDFTLPLIFFGRRDQIDIIRCDTGQNISSLKASNVKFIKWFLPSQHLRLFDDHHNDQQFGIITVDSSNILRFFPELFDPLKFKTNIVGTYTSYFRDSNGLIKLAVLVVESNGNVTKWIPFEKDSLKSKNLINKEVKFISDTNLILELNNLAELGTYTSNGKFGKFDSDWTEKYLNLNKKLFLVTNDQVCIIDSTTLELIGSISLKSQISSIYPFISETENLLVVNNSINILNLTDFSSVYKYGHNIDELNDYESVKASDVLYVKVELTNPDLLIVSTTFNRVLLLNTRNNTITSYLNVSTSRLYLYYYLASGSQQLGLEHSDANKAQNGGENANYEGKLNGNVSDYRSEDSNTFSPTVKYGLIGADDNCLVSFNLFELKLLFNKLAISTKIEVIANSQLIPNLLLVSSGSRLAQLDLHLSNNGTRIGRKLNGPDSSGMDSEFSGVNVEQLRSLDKNTSRILGNNLGSIRWFSLGNSEAGNRSHSRQVAAAAFHPRLPNICAIGHSDGSLHFLFIEHENTELCNLTFVHRFERPVKSVVWHLIPKGLSQSSQFFDADCPASTQTNPSRWTKKSNFMERIYKSINSSKYVSVVLVQLENDCSGDSSALFFVKLGDGSVHNLSRIGTDCCSYNTQTGEYIIQSDGNSTETGETCPPPFTTTPKPRLFNVFVIQYPPPSCPDLSPNEATEPNEHSRTAYNNFSVIYDYVCLTHLSENSLTLTLLLIDFELSVQLVKRFRVDVKGCVTGVMVTSKQYNQYHLYADSYLSKTACNAPNDATDNTQTPGSSPNSDLGSQNQNQDSNPNTLDPTRFDKCLNSMQQYLVVSTNLGYVYVTSLLRMYNNFLTTSGPTSASNNGFSPDNGSSEDFASFIHPEPLIMDETFIASTNILHLDHTILYSPNYSIITQIPNASPPTDSNDQSINTQSPDSCLCGSNCYFIIVVGLSDMILFYTLDVDHTANKFKLVLFYSMKANHSSFKLINEPFHYFKLLVNCTSSLHQYYLNYSQIDSFMAKYYSKH